MMDKFSIKSENCIHQKYPIFQMDNNIAEFLFWFRGVAALTRQTIESPVQYLFLLIKKMK